MMEMSAEKLEERDGDRFKSFMEKTPRLLKSKFLNVLGSSNEMITDFSNKLDMALSFSSSSESESTACRSGYTNEYVDDEDGDDKNSLSNFGKNTDVFDFEIRRIKERRAHEEIISGKYRHPNYMSDDLDDHNLSHNTTISDAISDSSPDIKSLESKSNKSIKTATSEISVSQLSIQTGEIEGDVEGDNEVDDNDDDDDDDEGACDSIIISGTQNSRPTSRSLVSNITLDSSDLKICQRSESSNSVPSWSSLISIDYQVDDDALDFMKKFIKVIFEGDTNAVTPELKSDFGRHAMTENGRMLFSRLINAQRVKFKRVTESTFYALVQYFAIVLFECAEADDFSPAKSLMNMCFTFFHEVDVPGCEPYREYLYNYLREQPIWLSLRFWNAAFFDALQGERSNRPIPRLNSDLTSLSSLSENEDDNDRKSLSASASGSSKGSGRSTSDKYDLNLELLEDQKFQQNISFGQLGTFTCNMHAFGLSKELCVEFLRKQSVIANLTKDQEMMLRENINRMYKETDKWRV